MSHGPTHRHGVALALAGWVVQSAGATWLLVLFWPRITSIPLVLPLPRGALGAAVGCAAAGTLLLGWGVAQIAHSKGHSRLFACLAPTWLAALLLVALLPDLSPRAVDRLEFRCPHCGVVTWIHLDFTGQSGPCRHCGGVVEVPSLLAPSDVRSADAPQAP